MSDFADIGIIMADFFDDGGNLDVVLSDIVLGLRLLARVQKLRLAEARQELLAMMENDDEEMGGGGTTAAADHLPPPEESLNEDSQQGGRYFFHSCLVF